MANVKEFSVEEKLTSLVTLQKIESKLDIFIYNHDLEILVKNPRAFDSFLLALAGQNVLKGQNREMPDWTAPDETKFIIPNFG